MLPPGRRSILFLLILSTLVIADYSGVMYNSNISAIEAKIALQVPSNATTVAGYDAYLANHTLIVIGQDIDLTERLLLDSAGVQNPWLAQAQRMNDSQEAIDYAGNGSYSLVIIIGGPYQSNATAIAIGNGWLNETQQVEGGLIIQDGKSQAGTVVLSVSDKDGFSNESLRRESADYSPLTAVVPKEYVPVAATAISFIFLSLLNIAYNAIQFKALDIGRKGRKIGERRIMVGNIDIAEPVALMGASVVLGIAITWQYFASDFFAWLAVCTVIALIGAIVHEITHKIFAVIFKIKIEYRFWPEGSVLTLISSFLGNSFAIQGFVLEEISPDVERWKVGLMKLSAPAVSAAIMIGFAFLNYLSPSRIFQLISYISALWAMVEMLPFSGMDGKDIKEWNSTVWSISFFVVLVGYVVVNFLL